MRPGWIKLAVLAVSLVVVFLGSVAVGAFVTDRLSFKPPTSVGECLWGTDVYAWLDENRNGVRDANEPALKEIEFVALVSGYNRTYPAKSDENGHSHISA